jgi:hypothetical protein
MEMEGDGKRRRGEGGREREKGRERGGGRKGDTTSVKER